MHFITFPVGSTNIFPLSNSVQGGQLVTEYNLRSREMVGTNSAITYQVGPSYTHSMNDFAVSVGSNLGAEAYDNTKVYEVGDYCTYNDKTYVCVVGMAKAGLFNPSNWQAVSLSGSILRISEGRAVINGHFVETLSPMQVDLALANALLKQQSQPALVNKLCIGIRAYYSTTATMSGAMLWENEDNMYTGVQLVVLPESEFITPEDSPTDLNQVTAHLKLATFMYVNGSVSDSNIIQNPDKVKYLNAERISNIENLIDSKFITKTDLNPKKIYTFTGEGLEHNKDTWCDSTGSLMVWDANPQLKVKPANYVTKNRQADFAIDNNAFVNLVIPHQQIDGIANAAGIQQYYPDRIIRMPKADYHNETAGTIDANYTKVIKSIAEKVNDYKQFINGRQILYLDIKNYNYEMPTISTEYNVGDYMLVRSDYTATNANDAGAGPSTIYVILPGYVGSVSYTDNQPTGVRLGEVASVIEGDSESFNDTVFKNLANLYSETKTYSKGEYVACNGRMYSAIDDIDTPEPFTPTHWNTISDLPDLSSMYRYTSYRGVANSDYFEVIWKNTDTNESKSYFYLVSSTGAFQWSDAILLTGGIPLATETQVGGFYNTSADVLDGGYVTRDENGRLRLIDYALLRSGTLAYQLGEDYTLPSNLTTDAIQEYLDEYVNSRVAFPFTTRTSSKSPMINVYLTLPAEDTISELTLCNLDSRFGTGVHLHIMGSSNNNTVINILDCEKLKIDSNIQGTPIINVVRTNLYYDANVFDYIRTCDTSGIRTSGVTGFQDIKLWYEKFEDTDPDLMVSGMEVSQPDAPMATEDITFWNDYLSNDNHYTCALRSITFSNNGNIVGCSVYVANDSTATNYVEGRVIIGGEFTLPQGSELNYPISCLTKSLRVTGTFVAAYATQEDAWVVSNTSFTAQTGVYESATGMSSGTIAFNSDTSLVPSTYVNVTSIDCWEPGTYHIFYGGITL